MLWSAGLGRERIVLGQNGFHRSGAAVRACCDDWRKFPVISFGHCTILVFTIGASVGAGQPIVEVVLSADGLTIEAMVAPKAIAANGIGLKDRIDVTADDSGIYGSMDRRVITISPDANVN